MNIIINPTEVDLIPVESSPIIGYVPVGLLEARDKDNRLIALLSMDYNRDSCFLSMNYFGRIYRTSLTATQNLEEVIESLLNHVNLTLHKRVKND